MARRTKAASPPLDLYDYLLPAPAVRVRPVAEDVPIRVTDDWPDFVPVTDQEARIIEAFFADVLDELFGPIP
ncbi:hypothetical protein CA606_12240 [Caulobacter vibrioides]|uniref:Uncharacterized protein n=1 Tax=Caulobacter vibrioides TaxID=155892 RepID=A0A290MZI0_CAUVI|nr:hypothetical protein [Caulobacter vibrioides]ATC33034.1 hypothetical protein CA606_12240 [Caulobacter vibrioides]